MKLVSGKESQVSLSVEFFVPCGIERRRKSVETEVDETMENYDILLNLAMIDVEEDHYTFVQSLVWMLESCGYLKEIASDPSNEAEVNLFSFIRFAEYLKYYKALRTNTFDVCSQN